MSENKTLEAWHYGIRQGDIAITLAAGDAVGEGLDLRLEVGGQRLEAKSLTSETIDRLAEALLRLVKLDSPA